MDQGMATGPKRRTFWGSMDVEKVYIIIFFVFWASFCQHLERSDMF